jgi:hypothetical protein
MAKRRKTRFWTVCRLVAATALLPGIAVAGTAQGTNAMQRWKMMDNCSKQAQTAFPDFSPAANAKREARLDDCLRANNLPPREVETPPAR